MNRNEEDDVTGTMNNFANNDFNLTAESAAEMSVSDSIPLALLATAASRSGSK